MGGRVFLVAVAALVVLTGCEEPFDAGMQAFDAGNWDQAVARFERVSPFDIRYREAEELIRQSLLHAGAEAFDSQQWRQAVGYYRQTTESDSEYTMARDRIGVSFYHMGLEALTAGDAAEALRLSNIVQSTCSEYAAARDVARTARTAMAEPLVVTP